MPRLIDILLVEDDASDVLLTRRGLENSSSNHTLSVVKDGVEALRFLRQQGEYHDVVRPDLILLDLNMPRMDGRELLSELKADESLKRIPVVVLTTSDADQDVSQSYGLHASCHVTKPSNLNQFTDVIKIISDFWLTVVSYPLK